MCKFLMTLIILKAAVIPLKRQVASGSEGLLCTNVNRNPAVPPSIAELLHTATAGCCIIMRCSYCIKEEGLYLNCFCTIL